MELEEQLIEALQTNNRLRIENAKLDAEVRHVYELLNIARDEVYDATYLDLRPIDETPKTTSHKAIHLKPVFEIWLMNPAYASDDLHIRVRLVDEYGAWGFQHFMSGTEMATKNSKRIGEWAMEAHAQFTAALMKRHAVASAEGMVRKAFEAMR